MSSTALARLHGVRRTDTAVDELEAAAEELDWRCIVLDGSEVEDRGAFLESCVDAFSLPEWFGMNWDALDVLRSAVRSWTVDGMRGGVLLVGEGPDLDVEEF